MGIFNWKYSFPGLWIHYGKYGHFSLWLWLEQSKFHCCHCRLFLGCAMEIAAFASTALARISLFLLLPVLGLAFFAPIDFLGNFLRSILPPSKAARTPFQSWDPPQNEGLTLTPALGWKSVTPTGVCAALVPHLPTATFWKKAALGYLWTWGTCR